MWKALLPRTVGDWLAELLAAGLLAVSVALVVTHWAMRVQTRWPYYSSSVQENFALLLAISGAYYSLDLLFGLVRGHQPPTIVSEEIRARQNVLVRWSYRWAKVAVLWWATFAIWFIIETAGQHAVGALVWLWPMWAVLLASVSLTAQWRDGLRTIIPRRFVDWLVESIVAVLLVLIALITAYTWAQPAFRQDAFNWGLLSSFNSLGPLMLPCGMLLARLPSTLRPDAFVRKYNVPEVVQWQRFRLYRTRESVIAMEAVLYATCSVAGKCHLILFPRADFDTWNNISFASALFIMAVPITYAVFLHFDKQLIAMPVASQYPE